MPNTWEKKTLQEWGSKAPRALPTFLLSFQVWHSPGGSADRKTMCPKDQRVEAPKAHFCWHPQIQLSCSMEVRRRLQRGRHGTWEPRGCYQGGRIPSLMSGVAVPLDWVHAGWRCTKQCCSKMQLYPPCPTINIESGKVAGTKKETGKNSSNCDFSTSMSPHRRIWFVPHALQLKAKDLAEGNVAIRPEEAGPSVMNGIWKPYQLVFSPEISELSTVWPIGSMYGIFTYIYHKNQPFM